MDCYQKLKQTLFFKLDADCFGDLSMKVLRRELKMVIAHLVDDRFPHVDPGELLAAQQRLEGEIETSTKEQIVESIHQLKKDLPPPKWRIGSWKWLPVTLCLWLLFVVVWVFCWPCFFASVCRRKFSRRWRSVPVEDQEYATFFTPGPEEHLKFRFLLDWLREVGRAWIPRASCDCCCQDLDLIAHGAVSLRTYSVRVK